MVEEAYVSFETAKLLKEKGFDEICHLGYNKNGEYFPTGNRKNSQIVEPDFCFICCPTQQMAMAWLRKEHNLHVYSYVSSDWSEDEDGKLIDEWNFWSYDITNTQGDSVYDIESGIDNTEYQSSEEACEAGIKYCLEKLLINVKK